MTDGESLLSRVVAHIAEVQTSETGRAQKSILSQAAASYARKPDGAEETIPTGFDPRAASLFEAVIEAAFLVANADDEFDDTERHTFEQVFHEASQSTVQPAEVHQLVDDLREQLEEDGLERRLEMVATIVASQEHRLEVLRIAALMAHISGGVNEAEKRVLDQLAAAFELEGHAVADTIDTAKQALEG